MATNRKSAIDAIEEMNQATRDAMDAKAMELSKIPLPEMRYFPFESAYADKTFNVRDEDSYSFDENKDLTASLRERGLEMRGGDNMSFSVQPDGRLLTLAGNLRLTIMGRIREDEIKRRAETGEHTGHDNPLPFAQIFGLVFTGLTREQEIALMADHTMKKELNRFELCKEIAEFVKAFNLTYVKAAVKFGIDKNEIQRMVMRYSMPTVMAEYRKQMGKDKTVSYVKVSNDQLKNLYTCYLADQEAGCQYRQEGLNFRRAWRDLTTDPKALTTPKKEEPVKSKPKESIEQLAGSLPATFGNNPEIGAIVEVLKWAANDVPPGQTINTQEVVSNLRDYCDKIRSERDEASKVAENANVELASLKEAYASLKSEYDTAIAHISDLESEIISLKAKPAKVKS